MTDRCQHRPGPEGPNRALPCWRDKGHEGDHEAFPGNPRGLSWPNVDAGLREAEEHANAGGRP